MAACQVLSSRRQIAGVNASRCDTTGHTQFQGEGLRSRHLALQYWYKDIGYNMLGTGTLVRSRFDSGFRCEDYRQRDVPWITMYFKSDSLSTKLRRPPISSGDTHKSSFVSFVGLPMHPSLLRLPLFLGRFVDIIDCIVIWETDIPAVCRRTLAALRKPPSPAAYQYRGGVGGRAHYMRT